MKILLVLSTTLSLSVGGLFGWMSQADYRKYEISRQILYSNMGIDSIWCIEADNFKDAAFYKRVADKRFHTHRNIISTMTRTTTFLGAPRIADIPETEGEYLRALGEHLKPVRAACIDNLVRLRPPKMADADFDEIIQGGW